MVASRRSPGVLWVHNDSGDSARVFALRESGATLAEVSLQGVDAIDWEDLSMGPGPEAGRDYLYVGDIGDNARRRPEIQVYRFPEPDVEPEQAFKSFPVSGVDAFTLRYPDAPGTVYDAEAMMVHPVSGALYLVTKTSSAQSTARVFRANDLMAGEATTLLEIGTLNFGTSDFSRVTGGDISPDGSELILRLYGSVRLWNASGLPSFDALFANPPCSVSITLEQQSEVIAFAPNNRDFYTTSEWRGGTPLPIFRHNRDPPVGEGESEGSQEGSDGEEESEGEQEGDGESESHALHSADIDGDQSINLSELLRVVQLYQGSELECSTVSEDGYQLGTTHRDCPPHASDWGPQDWRLNLSELLRTIQLFVVGRYAPCSDSFDGGFCPYSLQ